MKPFWIIFFSSISNLLLDSNNDCLVNCHFDFWDELQKSADIGKVYNKE